MCTFEHPVQRCSVELLMNVVLSQTVGTIEISVGSNPEETELLINLSYYLIHVLAQLSPSFYRSTQWLHQDVMWAAQF